MVRVIYNGKIDGEFDGFNGDKLFKMANGTYWIQGQYRYWYHYAYRPDALITEESGRYILTVKGQAIPVNRIDGVIESNIEGVFKGWDGKSTYKLVNGQTWEQAEYKYEYMYAYRPEVIIYSSGGSYIMRVQGTEARVRRVY